MQTDAYRERRQNPLQNTNNGTRGEKKKQQNKTKQNSRKVENFIIIKL